MTGKVEAPGLAGRRIGRGRPGRAHAAADHVRADDEIAVGVDRPARPDHGLPPARLAGDRMDVGDVLVAGQRMADQDRVAALGVERAVGLVGDLERREIDAGIEPQRLVGPEAHDRRMRLVRLAHAVGGIKREARVGFDHLNYSRPTDDGIARSMTYAWSTIGRPRTGLDRPARPAVNVFFAFALPAPYQSAAFLARRCRAMAEAIPFRHAVARRSARARSTASTRRCTAC